MKKILKVLIVIISINLCITFYLANQNSNSLKEEDTIDLVGNNKFWKASLNIHLNYDSELIIRPRRDDFNIPPELSIDIMVDGNSLYTDTLEYIQEPNNFLGKSMVVLDSDDYFNKDTDEIQLIIRYDNEISTIVLK